MDETNLDEAAKKAARDKADREKMTALGYDPENPEQFDKYQELQDKVAAKHITQQDALRGMGKLVYEQTDKAVRDTSKQQTEQRGQQEALPEPSQPDQVRSAGWTDRAGVPAQQAAALGYNKRANEHLQNIQERKNAPENDKQPQQQPQEPRHEQPAEKKEIDLPPEKSQADWRRMISDPEYRREAQQPQREVKEPSRGQETSQQARPAGDQPETKAEEKVDWRRALTDPDYSRHVGAQERAELPERAGEHLQEQGPEVKEPQRQQPQETPQPTRPIGDQPEKKALEEEVDWRRALTDPDYSRHVGAQERAELPERAGEQLQEQEREVKEPQRQQPQETPQPTRPVGDQLEKKASEEEVDWRRALTDPDYSRQIRAQERAERQERADERRQEEGLRRSASGREL